MPPKSQKKSIVTKPAVKTPVKTTVKTPVKTTVKTPVKTTVKTPVKTTKLNVKRGGNYNDYDIIDDYNTKMSIWRSSYTQKTL